MKNAVLWISLSLLLPSLAGAADVCAAARAGLTITDFSVEEGMVKARGTWEVGEGSPGVLIEYRIDQDRYQLESWSGAAGTWEFIQAFPACDRHTVRVNAFPSVKDGARVVHCVENVGSVTRTFDLSCAPVADLGLCEWECSEGPPARCAGTCTGTGRSGVRGKVALRGINDDNYELVEGPRQGPWTFTVTCAPGERVSFKLRDNDGTGAFSNVAERPCGVE